jgi:hypothetical protein
MDIRSLLGGIDEMSFKRTPDGWVFQSPGILAPFGYGSHYLVSDSQKEAIAARLRRMWVWTFVLIAIAAGTAPIIVDNFPLAAPQSATGKILVYGGVFIVLTLAVVFWQIWAIRPLLAGAQPTTERIGFAERMHTQVAAAKTWYVVTIEVAMLLLCVSAAVSMLMAASWLEFFGWFLSLCFFGALLVYYTMIVVLKLRRNA